LLLFLRGLANARDPRALRDRESRIVSGKEVTDPYKYDYIAYANNCGASLVAGNVLLSAAHCSKPNAVTLNKLKVNHDGRQTRESFRVTSELNHPKFKQEGWYLEYDFKLIRINGYSQNTPVALDDGNNGYASEGMELRVMGWGRTSTDGDFSESLLEVDVDVQDFGTCNTAYSALEELKGNTLKSDLHMCAGRTDNDGNTYDACNGDSGGPLVKYKEGEQDVQVGVVAFGNGCGNPTYPGVYGKVSSVIDWINETVDSWDCTPPGGRRRRRLKATKSPSQNKPKPNKSTKGKPKKPKATKVTKSKPKPVKPTKAPTGTGECPPAKEGYEWKEVKIDDGTGSGDPCGFVLNDDNIKEAVKLYTENAGAAITKYGEPDYWYTKDVTDMSLLFHENTGFNVDISGWDTSSVTNMDRMFYKAKKFNIGIGKWNTAKVRKMETMFEGAEAFNQDISMWNVDKVGSSTGFLQNAAKFDQDLCPWNNSDKFMESVGPTTVTGTACLYQDKPSQGSFCHVCETCSSDNDCSARSCAVATCGKVCSYDLSRKNVLRIVISTGGFPGDISFELTESSNDEVIMYAPNGSLNAESYKYEVDVCDGEHQICVGNVSGGVGAKAVITYKYTEKEVATVEMTGDTNTCKTFTVEAM